MDHVSHNDMLVQVDGTEGHRIGAAAVKLLRDERTLEPLLFTKPRRRQHAGFFPDCAGRQQSSSSPRAESAVG